MSRKAGLLGGLVLAAALAFTPAALTQTRQATADLRLDQSGVTIAPEVYGQFMEQFTGARLRDGRLTVRLPAKSLVLLALG